MRKRYRRIDGIQIKQWEHNNINTKIWEIQILLLYLRNKNV